MFFVTFLTSYHKEEHFLNNLVKFHKDWTNGRTEVGLQRLIDGASRRKKTKKSLLYYTYNALFSSSHAITYRSYHTYFILLFVLFLLCECISINTKHQNMAESD